MRKGFFARVNRVIAEADVVLEVVDARMPELTRNKEIEGKVLGAGKKLVIVLNKADLVSKNAAKKAKKELLSVAPAVFVSGTKKTGAKMLRRQVKGILEKKRAKIAVIGYPNVGKSSVINLLSGRASARVAAKSGFTRGEQLVRVGEGIYLIDTPGIIPFWQRNEFELALVGAKNANQVRDAEHVALLLVEWLKRQGVKEVEGIELAAGAEEFLEKFALKRKKLLKGGVADTRNASQILINEWQKGKIRA